MNNQDRRKFTVARIILASTALLAIIIIGYWLDHHVAMIENRLAHLGHWAGIGFIVLFLVVTPFFFSVDVLCLIAGTLFGLADAIIYVMIATMLGAALIFFIGRYLARDKVQGLLEKHPKLTFVNQVIAGNGLKIMFLIRLLPIPFALLSYVFSVSQARFLPYWLATTGIFLYNSMLVYFGYLAGHFTDQLTQGEHYSGPHTSLLVGGIMACLLVVILISKVAKAQIAQLHPGAEEFLE